MYPETGTVRFYKAVLCSKDEMTNCVGPDQKESKFALIAQTCLP